MSDAFSTVPVRTDTGVTLDTQLVTAIPTGSNTIGAISAINSALPAGANSIGSVSLDTGSNTIGSINTVASITGALPTGTNSLGTVGLNTGVNTIGSNASIVNALPAGTNLLGKVEVVNTSGAVKHFALETAADVVKNGGQATIDFQAITNGTTGELRSISVAASVAMKAEIRKDTTLAQTIVLVVYLPAGGGTISKDLLHGAVSQVATAAGEHFDVVFTNLDKTNDAEAHAAFTWTEE